MTTLPWRISAAAALLTAALACGGNPDTNQPAPSASPEQEAASGDGVQVTGKLAPALAPPSSLVALEPRGEAELPVKSEPAVMDQVSLEFLPTFLVVQTGQTVEFRNSEDVLHNIRVTEVAGQKPVFNVATPPSGTYAHKFERPGFYNVGCDIHSTMRADLMVIGTPYTATTGVDGSFTMVHVAPGQYNLTVYAGAAPVVRAVEVKSGRTDLGLIQ
jgi:plastocyanin